MEAETKETLLSKNLTPKRATKEPAEHPPGTNDRVKAVPERGEAEKPPREKDKEKDGRARTLRLVDGSRLDASVFLRALLSVRAGDFSVRLPGDWTGLAGKIADTFNDIVTANARMSQELQRIGQAVGKEGRTSQRVKLGLTVGSWSEMENSINALIDDLLWPMAEVTRAISAVAQGDLQQTVKSDLYARPLQGEFLRSATIVNTMIHQLGVFASEVTRVAREVGIDGELGGQAQVPGVGGVWKDLTENVNSMASNLTAQVRNISEVATAIARGDLSRKITVAVRGEILQLKETINTMVDQLNAFASEVTRVAREVGTEGKLGGQAQVPGVAGTWKDLTDNVNSMASNLTDQVRNIAQVTTAVARGDLSRKITVDVKGEILELKDTVNTMVDQLNAFAAEVTRVAREVGTEGNLGGQAQVLGVAGTWKDLTDNVNSMASNLTAQVRNIAEVATAIARGDLSKKITVEVRGEILQLKETINTMVDQLNAFASEVTRVAREVGTEGKLGGQARVPGVAGTWKDLTDNVNVMAANLTEQVRGIVKVVTAVADGDLQQKLLVNSKGEVAALAETINNMTHTLATFADQVTTVAREVGVDGRLGGQANVPGASGTWKDLTGNVNRLAANLTTQVRAIAEVATAVTKGDLTRSIQVDARGEVAELKDNINTMIRNLRLTTDRNTEQDWLKTNLARFTGMLQGQRDLATVGKLILSELVPLVGAHQGVIYQVDHEDPEQLVLLAAYGNPGQNGHPRRIEFGDGFVGQCAADKRRILITSVPSDTVPVGSVLMQALPRAVVVLPIEFEGQIRAVLGLATLESFATPHLTFVEQLTASIGIVLNSIKATMQTELLLKQSQQLATELQTQQKELQQTNEELALKAQQLAEQNAEVERKNQEIEQARRALEEKAAELALTSKYKSEFLANMSHELRTPLNSILILGQQLGDNPEGNLSPKQVEFARTIHGAGSDLLTLITDILDLSKIESGTVTVEAMEVSILLLLETAKRDFRHEAEARKLWFDVQADPGLDKSSIHTDSKRLLQVLKNLLSNAFKFTEKGGVNLNVYMARSGWSPEHPVLNTSEAVLAFEVTDTGVGIALEKQRIIFEAFQQADAGTSRKYGGTGLGLAISRELANLLGGEIQLRSSPGKGSTFTLFLPRHHAGAGTASDSRQSPGAQMPVARTHEHAVERVPDDRHQLRRGEPTLLVVEDDPHYGRVLADQAHGAGFQVLVAMRGEEALEMAREYQPTAISLDMYLPDMLGWAVLDRLKQSPQTRHIPVQILTLDEDRQHGLARGAYAFVSKPTTADGLFSALERLREYVRPRRKRLLLVEDDPRELAVVSELLGHDDIEVVPAGTGTQALEELERGSFDCAVLDLMLPDMTGFELLDRIGRDATLRELPVVVFTGKELSPQEDERLRQYARSVVVKGVESPERLLDETALFLHRDLAAMPEQKRAMIERLHHSDDDLRDKLVLVVDDDVRNIFALSSALERHGMRALTATTGREAIALLESTPEISIVLMDVMMPEMDGFETMRVIRQNADLRRMPIVALTAKAMKGDRERCMEAGASDYLAKPVDTEQLLSALRTWLHR